LIAPVTSTYGATATVSDGRLVVSAAAGDADDVVVTDPSRYQEPSADYFSVLRVTAGAGCRAAVSETRCDKAGVSEVLLDLGDQPDVGSADVPLPTTLLGGNGGDRLTVPHDGLVDGGPGDDTLTPPVGEVRAEVRGGIGRDTLELLSYYRPGHRGGWTARLDDGTVVDPAGHRWPRPLSAIEDVRGTDRADVIVGNAGSNALNGGYSTDAITGLGGDDTIDAIDLSPVPTHQGTTDYDNLRDRIACGEGFDRVQADVLDRFGSNCERVLVSDFAGEGGSRHVMNGDNRPNALRGAASIRNEIRGRGGDDRIVGGARRDWIYAGPGDDSVKARAGKRDTVGCGRGEDTVVADRYDRLHGCEQVTRR
jgi:Ca2+-binding RTX toxin-like protein